jgi:hypothetical protein
VTKSRDEDVVKELQGRREITFVFLCHLAFLLPEHILRQRGGELEHQVAIGQERRQCSLEVKRGDWDWINYFFFLSSSPPVCSSSFTI